MRSLALVYGGLLVLEPLCALAQRLWPSGEAPRVFARERRLDWLYWLVTPLLTGVLTRAATIGALAVAVVAIDHDLDPQTFWSWFHARSPIGRQPLWLQAVEVLVLSDFLGYWSHRLRHTRMLWPLHAVHHAPERLDWLAAARMHPFDDLIDNVLVGLPVLLLGFDPLLFLALDPLLLLHTLYLHMAVRWRLGPLGHLLVSPVMHRWHHARDPVTQNANFGGVLSIWDRLFATWRVPARAPDAFGVDEALPERLPETLRAQLWQPILRLARFRQPK